MSDAVFYRKGIGDDDKAIADTKYFIDTFGTKKPTEAADAAFSLTSIYEKQGDNDAVIKHLARLHPHVGHQGWRGQARHRARQDRPDPVAPVAAR